LETNIATTPKTQPPQSAPEEETQVRGPSGDGDTAVLPVDDHAPPSEGAPTEKPKVADGIELIGKYEDSGFKEAPYLARRADGQVIQLAPLLYLIAELADGNRTYEEIAAATSEAIKRGVSADNVRQLVDKRLRPLGVIAGADGAEPELQKLDPLLALKFRAAVVPPSVVNAITKVFEPLFFPLVVVAVLGGLVALDVWLFAFHGVAQSLRQTLYDPALLLMMLGLVILSAAFHECGHASACAYGGAKPGAMGVGLYIVWPAFYTDVTDAYRLNKIGRLRTDLGGVYFNVIFILATAGAYAVTGFEPLLLMIPLQHLEIVHQFLPFIRLDGYYIVSDLTGVPDMFSRIRPTLASLIPWKPTHQRVKELKPWVRGAVTVYVLTVVPLLLFMFGLMAINAPRIFATAWDSFFVQWHKVQHEFSEGSAFAGTFGIVQMLVLILPALGIVVTFSRTLMRLGKGVLTKTEGKPAVRAVAAVAVAAAASFVGSIWWPNGDYRPIQPGEKGTFQGAIGEFQNVSTGRPALTRQRSTQLGGAQFTNKRSNGSTVNQGPGPSSGEQTTPEATSSTDTTEPTTSAGDTGTVSTTDSTTDSSTDTSATDTTTTTTP
jgi:putative peptide zinc metalloprotease protein